MDLPTPSDLLGAGQLDTWYPGQYEQLERSLEWYSSPSQFLGVAAPTGSGKTISALLLSRLAGIRTVVLTATKGLQAQYQRDASLIGGVVVVGQNNFPCLLIPGIQADEGPCHDGLSCSLREQCPYRVQLKAALESDLVITNYAYWLAQTNFSSGLGDVGLLICDEGHQAFGAMENYLTIFISRLDIQPMGLNFPPEGSDSTWSTWKVWAEACSPVVEDQVTSLDVEIRKYRSQNDQVPGHISRAYRTAKSLSGRLKRLSDADEQWIIQRTYHGYRFVPKWVSLYSGQLFRDIPKVVIMSAILSGRSCDYLGIPGDRSWVEMDSYFPAANTPIWHIPTARINYRTDDYGSTLWASRIDQIIQRRLDRKGIIFTVSYERARMVLSRSRYKDIMLTHSTNDVVRVVEKFKSLPPPAVLVSPSVTTGWDFPGLDYIVVGKLPYPDTTDPVTQARHQEDNEWTSYLAMETLVQECGRGTRSASDRCEVLVIDDSWLWFWGRYKQFSPQWFRSRVKGSLQTVPDPLIGKE